MNDSAYNDDRDIFSVSRLNREVRSLLELKLGLLWIEGEISNLAMPSSGHVYFSLKDQSAQLRCAFFKNRIKTRFQFNNGDKVVLRARVSLYEPRGEYQLLVEHMEAAGLGALQQQFEALKQKLAAEGLFAKEHKQAIKPFSYQRVGVISSSSGAALHDVLSVLQRRRPDLEVLIFPCLVQGEQAPAQLIKAIHHANLRADCDCLLLVRGGGSLEDLWAFNDAKLAYAIADSRLPIISGVGHESDFTIADFVADQRAPTPSVAAESVSFASVEMKNSLEHYVARFDKQLQRQLAQAKLQIEACHARLTIQHPRHVLAQRYQRIDELQSRMQLLITQQQQRAQQAVQLYSSRLNTQHPNNILQKKREHLAQMNNRLPQLLRLQYQQAHKNLQQFKSRLQAKHPHNIVRQHQKHRAELQQRLQMAWRWQQQNGQQRLAQYRQRLRPLELQTLVCGKRRVLAGDYQRLLDLNQLLLTAYQSQLAAKMRALNAVSPLLTLQRGYSIALDAHGKLLSAQNARQGQPFALRGHDYQLECEIVAVQSAPARAQSVHNS